MLTSPPSDDHVVGWIKIGGVDVSVREAMMVGVA
jgi:hypothetical protein